MANQISRKFQNVTWKNIETKDAVNCHILLNFDDGTTQILKAVVSNPSEGSPNPDWTQIMEEIGADLIDSNTTEAIQARDSPKGI